MATVIETPAQSGQMSDGVTKRTDKPAKLFFLVTEDWYFVSHRLSLAKAAIAAGYEVTVVTRINEFGQVIESCGCRVIPFHMSRRGLNPVSELQALVRLIRLLRRERVDILHNVALKPAVYGGLAAMIARTPRVVNAIAGLGWLFSSRSGVARVGRVFAKRVLSLVLRRGMVIVQNPDDEREIAGLGIPSRQIVRVPGAGVDLQQFSVGPELDGPIVVLFPARLIAEKGVREFVEAARLLIQSGLPARFVLAGQPDAGNPSSISLTELEGWVSSGVVEHLGWVKDMPSAFRSSHIVCMPSYYGEGIPKSLIEAAASGRAIVTTDMPGCKEIVRHGVNGLLVPPRNVESLAEALKTLICSDEQRRRMGVAGRKLAEEEFSVERVTDSTLAVYQAAL